MSYLMSWVDVFTEKLLKLNEILINGNNEIRGEKEMCTSCSYQISARETFHRAKKKTLRRNTRVSNKREWWHKIAM